MGGEPVPERYAPAAQASVFRNNAQNRLAAQVEANRRKRIRNEKAIAVDEGPSEVGRQTAQNSSSSNDSPWYPCPRNMNNRPQNNATHRNNAGPSNATIRPRNAPQTPQNATTSTPRRGNRIRHPVRRYLPANYVGASRSQINMNNYTNRPRSTRGALQNNGSNNGSMAHTPINTATASTLQRGARGGQSQHNTNNTGTAYIDGDGRPTTHGVYRRSRNKGGRLQHHKSVKKSGGFKWQSCSKETYNKTPTSK
jgi:hypothetical protein